MKIRTLTLAALLIASASTLCAQTNSSIKSLEWLLGNWARTGMKSGKSAFEGWTKKSDTEWAGLGVTLNGNDTVFVEKLKIVVKEGQLYYVADVPENKSEVLFKITSASSSGFVCENPNHDFPKRIEYALSGGKLKATISAGEKKIDYFFERR